MRDDFCMMNGGEYRTSEQDGDDADEYWGKSLAPRERQRNDGGNRDERRH